MNNIPIKIENNDPVISTLDIAKGMDQDHRSVFRLVKKFEKDLNSIRSFAILNRKTKSKKGGRPESYCFLNEEQTIFLVTLMRNVPKVIQFKKQLSRDFMRMRKQLMLIAFQQKDPTWIAQREVGKITRKETTDIIQKFVEYATAQGSKDANRYYCNISKMQNKALFILEQKFPNLRDILDLNQLATVDVSDAIISKALAEGMTSNLHYKDIYKLARNRVEAFVELRGQTFISASNIEKERQYDVIGC